MRAFSSQMQCLPHASRSMMRMAWVLSRQGFSRQTGVPFIAASQIQSIRSSSAAPSSGHGVQQSTYRVANSAVPLSPSKRQRGSDATQEDPGTLFYQSRELPSHGPHPHDLGWGSFSPGAATGANLEKALKSVVKVFATIACPNYATPWQMHPQSKSTATGFVISGRRILTNAHAVANQVQVQLRKHGNARKFTAKVVAVGHECDIAMLTVEEEEFWTGVEALEIEGLPAMQESVSVVGYPTGGDNVCVTKGVVSRLDRQQYSHGRTSLLALQIDAAINSGNSGGPVLKRDKVIGIAFQCLTQGENIGFVIPVPVINHFLEDLSRHEGQYTGFCDLGASWQTLESSDHKAALGMPKSVSGVYVTALEPCYHSAKVLKPGDVITSFNQHSVADDGTFLFEPHLHEHQGLYFKSLKDLPLTDSTSPAGRQLRPKCLPLELLEDESRGPALLDFKPAVTLAPSDVLLHQRSPSLLVNASDCSGQEGAGRSIDKIAEEGFEPRVLDLTQAEDCSQEASCDSRQEQGEAASVQAFGSMTAPAAPADADPSVCSATLVAALAPASATPSSSSNQAQPMAQAGPGNYPLPHRPQPAYNFPLLSSSHSQSSRIDFRHLVAMNFDGDECQLGVWRDGAELPGGVKVKLTPPKQLVPVHSHDQKPHYFIFGGLVFTPLTNFYLRSTYGTDWTHKAPIKLCDRSFAGFVEAEGQDCVILSKVLAWECNAGYQDLGNVEVLKACGVKVHSLAHLAQLLTHAPGPYVRLDLQWNKVVMLDVAKARACTAELLRQNCIPGAGAFPEDISAMPLALPDELFSATQAALGVACPPSITSVAPAGSMVLITTPGSLQLTIAGGVADLGSLTLQENSALEDSLIQSTVLEATPVKTRQGAAELVISSRDAPVSCQRGSGRADGDGLQAGSTDQVPLSGKEGMTAVTSELAALAMTHSQDSQKTAYKRSGALANTESDHLSQACSTQPSRL